MLKLFLRSITKHVNLFSILLVKPYATAIEGECICFSVIFLQNAKQHFDFLFVSQNNKAIVKLDLRLRKLTDKRFFSLS